MSEKPQFASWRDPLLWVAITVVAGALIVLSLARYHGYNSGMYDLGNMAQAIWSATQGEPLLFSRPEGYRLSRLAGHVEFGYFLLVPLYALWSDPRLLLIIQALAFALGAIPAYRIAARRLASRFAARCCALIYLLYPVALTAVLFDFHADTIAAPLLLLAIDLADTRRWRAFALVITLALSLKVYIAAAVVVLGVVLWRWEGHRRAGLLTFAAGLAYGALAFFVVRQLFKPQLPAAEGDAWVSYLTYYFSGQAELLQTLGQRLLSALVVFGPPMMIAWRGWRWLLPGVPIAIAALISTGPGGAYDYRYHHYALVVPFLVMAAIDGAARAQTAAAPVGRPKRNWRADLAFSTVVVTLCSFLLVNTPLHPLAFSGAPGYGFDPIAYGTTPRDRVKDAFLTTVVPPDAPIATSNFFAAHLTQRKTLYLLRYPTDPPGVQRLERLLPQIDYALADALFDYYMPLADGYAGGLDGELDAISFLLQQPEFSLVAARDGLLLFARHARTDQQLIQRVERLRDTGTPAETRFGDAIALVRYEITLIDARRVRAEFTWRTNGTSPTFPLLAVSRLAGVEHTRIPHLPSYALHPVAAWQAGELVHETFGIDLPAGLPAGNYTWQTGWDRADLPQSAATDDRSLLAGSEVVSLGTIHLP